MGGHVFLRFRTSERLNTAPMNDPRLASMSPDELRTAMRAMGYKTQTDLASAIAVSRSAVSL